MFSSNVSKTLLVAGLLLTTAATATLFAQPASQPAGAPAAINPNVGHHHHHHRHGHPHPTVQDPNRFHTDRPSPKMLPLPTEQDAFTFVVFGDRTGGPDDGVSILADAVRDANLIEPDFVITVGDLIQGYNETPQWMEQMREFKEIMGHLKSPWFPVAGNHDIYWRDKDGSGDAKPMGEHESEYEMHFGPLWYAFEHKNNWFIALYSDEGNPETGEKSIHKPETQRMSPEQLQWLKETLEKARDADHVFLFLHHPRWRGENYGDDWEKVHKLLVEAGNVTAVFAGHIHHMTYEGPRGGIEYVSLATVGGGNSFKVPEVGYLHHFNIVTVRKDQISMAAVPVGEVIDPREMTEQLKGAAVQLTEVRPQFEGTLAMNSDASADTSIQATIENPTPYPVDVTVVPESSDSRWAFSPDHNHALIAPGERKTFQFDVQRIDSPVDKSLRLPELSVKMDLLTDAFRYSLPESRTLLPIDLSALRSSSPEDRVLTLDGDGDYLTIPTNNLPLPNGPITLETWMRAERFGDRVGLVTKMQGSEYGIFVSKGRPSFAVHVDGGYVTARGKETLQTGRWYHVAGVYDGSEVRLYIDGQLVDRRAASGSRKTNNLPLIIGGDVGGNGEPMSFFAGQIDDLHVSKQSRYTGERFQPAARPVGDADTILLLNFDEEIGRWLFDHSPRSRQVQPKGDAELIGEERSSR